MILRDAIVVLSLGTAAGMLVALIGASYLDTLLYRIATSDSVSLAIAALLLAATALMASWIPAMRASRLDPAVVLRH
jgi:ABC-type lipoprotein release transport system permease subunit